MSASHSSNGPWTVARLLAWTRAYFERHRVESPRLCAEILLSHALTCRRLELYTRHETIPSDEALASFRAAVVEAARGRPIAYLTGTKDFFSLTFEVTPDVLVPRPETEVLVERTIDLVRQSGAEQPRILDVGTGSGCVAIALAKNLASARLGASDVSEAALAVAQRNAARHGVAERIEFRLGDLYSPWQEDTAGMHPAAMPPFDVIVSNPPYIGRSQMDSLPATVRDYEPHTALFAGKDGLDVIRRLLSDGPHNLAAGGHLLLEVAHDQAGAVRELIDGTAWEGFTTYKDDLRYERVIQVRRRGGAARIHPRSAAGATHVA